MKVLLLGENRLNKLILPEKIEGSFWVVDSEENNIVNIESNEETRILENNSIIDSVILRANTFYTIDRNGVQSKCNSLFDTVSTKKAFFGQQSAVVDTYLKEVAKSIGVLMTSVMDLQEHLYRLTGNNYRRKNLEVQMDFTPKNETIDKILEQGSIVVSVNPTNRWGISSN